MKFTKIKTLTTVLLVSLSGSVFAGTNYIHKWAAGIIWRTDINIANMCHTKSTDVVIQLWNADGSLLANKQLSSNYATDSDGKIYLTLAPHESKDINFDFSQFSNFATGNGTISTYYQKPGSRCLVGGYQYHTTVGSNNPYGHSHSYQFNNGRRF